jgi:hypothetical protein
MLEVNLFCDSVGLQVNVPECPVVPRKGENLYWEGTAYEVHGVTYEFQERDMVGAGWVQVTVATVVVEPI